MKEATLKANSFPLEFEHGRRRISALSDELAGANGCESCAEPESRYKGYQVAGTSARKPIPRGVSHPESLK